MSETVAILCSHLFDYLLTNHQLNALNCLPAGSGTWIKSRLFYAFIALKVCTHFALCFSSGLTLVGQLYELTAGAGRRWKNWILRDNH